MDFVFNYIKGTYVKKWRCVTLKLMCNEESKTILIKNARRKTNTVTT